MQTHTFQNLHRWTKLLVPPPFNDRNPTIPAERWRSLTFICSLLYKYRSSFLLLSDSVISVSIMGFSFIKWGVPTVLSTCVYIHCGVIIYFSSCCSLRTGTLSWCLVCKKSSELQIPLGVLTGRLSSGVWTGGTWRPVLLWGVWSGPPCCPSSNLSPVRFQLHEL